MTALQIIFYIFSAILIGTSTMVIVSRNPVHGVLFLVFAFVASSMLWMLLQAEFLSLVLIFVYVGAVMTLFLFVVMMLNIDLVPLREGFVRYLPVGILAIVILLSMMIFAISPKHFGSHYAVLPLQATNYSNVKALGAILYTQYLFAFELAAVLLLVAIIAAISLAFRGRRESKIQDIAKQLAVQPRQQVRIINMKSEPRG